MTAQHTPGPWGCDDSVVGWWSGEQPGCMVRFYTRSHDGRVTDGHALANCLTQSAGHFAAEANAARIVACVNACEGIPDPSVVGDAIEALRGWQKLHDDMLEAGGDLAELPAGLIERFALVQRDLMEQTRIALANIEGIPS